jgi:hypothetical protein
MPRAKNSGKSLFRAAYVTCHATTVINWMTPATIIFVQVFAGVFALMYCLPSTSSRPAAELPVQVKNYSNFCYGSEGLDVFGHGISFR